MFQVLFNLPHPLEFIWVIWLLFIPGRIVYLLRRDPEAHQLSKSGELMNIREVLSIGCLGGFILLTFIFALCTWYTLTLNEVI